MNYGKAIRSRLSTMHRMEQKRLAEAKNDPSHISLIEKGTRTQALGGGGGSDSAMLAVAAG